MEALISFDARKVDCNLLGYTCEQFALKNPDLASKCEGSGVAFLTKMVLGATLKNDKGESYVHFEQGSISQKL